MAYTKRHLEKLFNNIIKDSVDNKEGLVAYLTDFVMDRYGAPDELMIIALNVAPDLPFTVGDHIYVSRNALYMGSTDNDAMLENGLLLEEDHSYVKGVITGVKSYSTQPYTVKFTIIDDKGTFNTVNRDVSENHVHYKEFIPGPDRLNVGDII
ncbi:hypothetical protein EB118_20160 [bacterium]|nr:hypothetical protein [bacterium]NDG32377.1 hypothetical protein [bacterium]